MLSHGEYPGSLSHLTLNPYRVVTDKTDRRTDGRTDRIAITNTRSQQYLPVQLSRVKILPEISEAVRIVKLSVCSVASD